MEGLLALVVAVAMIIGVNYANDYSDGIRGTDDVRRAAAVGRIPFGHTAFGAHRRDRELRGAAAAGVALALVSAPWLIVVGGVCIAGAWLYTGGSNRTATWGWARSRSSCSSVWWQCSARNTRRQAGRLGRAGTCGVGTGSLSSAVLVANNLRDIPTDKEAEKITLAVRLGDARTRLLYQGLLAVALLMTLLLMLATPWCAVGLIRRRWDGGRLGRCAPARRQDLIPVLRDTG